MNSPAPASSAPRWVVIYLWITVVMAAAFSLLAYLNPGVQFATWPAIGAAGALSLSGPLGVYIARNLATVVAVATALGSRQPAAVRVAVVLRLATDAIDAAHNMVAGNLPGAGFASVMAAIEVVALLALRKNGP